MKPIRPCFVFLLLAGCYDFASLGGLYRGDGGGGDASGNPDGGTCSANLGTDPHHCGSCAHDCGSLPGVSPVAVRCASGICDLTGACLPGRAHCSTNPDDGCESDITVASHCGSCTTSCMGATPLCSGSASGYACAASCGGTTPDLCAMQCVSYLTDPKNCGFCAFVCPTAPGQSATCAQGHCGLTCDSTHHFCNNVCVANNDIQTCGAACTPCSAPTNGVATCDGTACGFDCKPGFTKSGMACVAQVGWKVEMSGVTGNLNRVWGEGPTTVFAAGDNGVILHSYGDGNWKAEGVGVTTKNLFGLWGSGLDIWAVGDQGVVLHSATMGNWTLTTLMTAGGVPPGFSGLWGTSSSDMFAVGGPMAIFHYDGTGWTAQSTTLNNIDGVWGDPTGGGQVFSVGESESILLYNGTSWSTQRTGTPNISFWGVGGNRINNVYVVGGYSSPVMLHSTDVGTTWNNVPLTAPTTGSLWSVWVDVSDEAFAVGSEGTILHLQGTSWTREHGGPTDASFFLSVWGSSPTDVYAVGNNGMIYHKH